MKHYRSVSLHTASTYCLQLSVSRAHMCLWYLHIHATVSLVAGPYRLIDGDSRVGNPIHRAEDKFHVPQCVSKWETQRVAVARSTAVTSGAMVLADLCISRAYMCAREGALPPTLVSNCVHWDGWVQEIPCNSNSLNSYVVRLFLTVVPRITMFTPHPSIYVYLLRQPRFDLEQNASYSNAV